MALDFQDEDIRDNFTKVSFTEAKCKHCDSKFTHTIPALFFDHIKSHKIIFDYEAIKKNVKMWRFIRINEEMEKKYHCVICKQDVAEFIDQNNWSHHVHEDHFLWNFYEDWQWKYCVQVDDFLVKCHICEAKFMIVFCWDILTKHMKEAHINLLKTVVLNFKDEEIQAKFTKLTFTVAQCKTCKRKFTHTYIKKFSEHVNICVEENKQLKNLKTIMQYQWKYIRLYRRKLGQIQCVLCKAFINFNTNECYEHLHDTDNFTLSACFDKEEWKYREIKQEDDFKVKCYLCLSEILVDFCKDDLINHIRECDSSIGILPPLSITDLGLDINEEDALNLLNFTNFSNDKAECRTCKCSIIHSSIEISTNDRELIGSFYNHINEKHTIIIDFENNLLKNSPNLKYLKICNDSSKQCVLCKEIIIDESDNQNHIHDADNYISRCTNYEDWKWKYCKRKNNISVICNFCSEEISILYFGIDLITHFQRCKITIYPLAPKLMDKTLSKNFAHVWSDKAKCEVCCTHVEHTDTSSFLKHIYKNHPKIVDFEEELQKVGLLGRYIRKWNNVTQCVLCEKCLTSEKDYKCHIHINDDIASTGKSYAHWQWKYCEVREMSQVKCMCGSYLTNELTMQCMYNHLKICKQIKLMMYEQQTELKILWTNFRRLSYKRVECKTCNSNLSYINKTSIYTHIINKHKHIHHFDTLYPDKKCTNLQFFNGIYKCTICQVTLPSETDVLLNHKCREDKNAVSLQEDMLFTYSIRINDFQLLCAVCSQICNIKNTKYIKPHKCRSSEINQQKNQNEEVWQYFTRESCTTAKCNYCKQIISYATVPLFVKHVEQEHPTIHQFETQIQSIRSWKYIKYVNQETYACVLCSKTINSDEVDIHMHDADFCSYALNFENWPWKYCVSFDDLSVRCDICREKINMNLDTLAIRNHVKESHPASILQQNVGIEDQAGPSAETSGVTPKKQLKIDFTR